MKKAISFLSIISAVCFMHSANSASFDCTKAKSYAEKTICSNPELSNTDEALKNTYDIARSVAHNKQGFSQLTKGLWSDREKCSDYKCIDNWYNYAFVVYDAVIKTNSSEGVLGNTSNKKSPTPTQKPPTQNQDDGLNIKKYECFDSRDGNLVFVTDYGDRFTIFTKRLEKFESGIVTLQPNGSFMGISKDGSEYYILNSGNNYIIQYQGYSIEALGCRLGKD